MERKDVVILLKKISDTYPNHKLSDKSATADNWFEYLKPYNVNIINYALDCFVLSDTTGFAPTIGQLMGMLKTIVKQQQNEQELNEMQAWALVSKALRNGYYHAQEEFDNLPPTVQKAVGTPSQLRNWAITDIKSIETVIQSNFMRSYNNELKKKKEFESLPINVQQYILGNKTNNLIEQSEKEVKI